MRFGFAIVYVPDVPATIAFWEQAFGLARRFVVEGGDYGELETGGTVLAFASEALAASHGFAIRPNRAGEDPAGFEVALVTEDVQAAFDRAVAAGATPASDPEQKPWGQTVGYVRDPNGVLVELCTPVDG
jgi:lactoylglutathione lyase